MTDKTGGSAFPASWHPNMQFVAQKGMSLRDYLAAKAMNGYLSNSWQAKEIDETGDSAAEQMELIADAAYLMADAMLKARG